MNKDGYVFIGVVGLLLGAGIKYLISISPPQLIYPILAISGLLVGIAIKKIIVMEKKEKAEQFKKENNLT